MMDPAEQIILRAADGGVDLLRAAAVRPDSVDETTRSIEVVLATESPVRVMDERSGMVVDQVLRLDLGTIPEQVPMLVNHGLPLVEGRLIDPEKTRGSLRDFRIEGDELVCRAYFASDPDSDSLWMKYRDRHLRAFSVGARIRRGGSVMISPGNTEEIAGRAMTAGEVPLQVAVAWDCKEGSCVTIGADARALTRASNEPPITHPTGTVNRANEESMDFNEWLKAKGFDTEALNDAQRSTLRAAYDAEHPPKEGDRAEEKKPEEAARAAGVRHDGDEIARAEGVRLERERVRKIREAGEGCSPVLVQRACNEGWDINRARQEFLDDIRVARGAGDGTQSGAGGVGLEIGRAAEDKFAQSVEDALVLRAGFPVAEAERVSQCRSLMGAGIQDIARACLQVHRMPIPHDTKQLWNRAASTFSFPTALGNTLNRILQSAYESYPSTIMEWASRGEVKDFREHKHIRMGKFAKPERVNKGGEVKHGTLSEEAEGYSADTYGQQFLFDRQDFINDDLGLFDRVPAELGESMRMNIDDIGYSLLISAAGLGPTLDSDGVALFNADRTDGSNYYVNAAANLSSVSLAKAKELLRKVKQNGREINIVPRFLVVPPELEQTALELVNSSHIVSGSTGKNPSINTHQGTLTVIVEPRLSGATNGATAWYLVADKSRARSLQVSFLRGQSAPTIERLQMSSPLTMGWLAYHDVGVDAIDWRGIFRSKGAA